MGTVVRLAQFRNASASRPPGSTSDARRHGHGEFTLGDRSDLDKWSSADRRVAICSCDMGTFAMVYRNDMPWASWGIVRQENSVLVWDCVTLADIGRFSSMAAALAVLPGARRVVSGASVLPFAAAQQRCAAAG